MGAATMPGNAAGAHPAPRTLGGRTVPTLQGCPLSFKEECGVLHVSPDAAVVACEPQSTRPPIREHGKARCTSKASDSKKTRVETTKLEPCRYSAVGDFARLQVQVPLIHVLLDLMGHGHTEGKQPMENVRTQVVGEKHTATDAGYMVAVPKHAESAAL